MPVTNNSTNITTNRYLDDHVLGFRATGAPMFNIFSMNATSEASGRDKVVQAKVFIPSGSAVTDYNAANGFVMNATSRTGIQVTLDRYKYCSAALSQQEILESSVINLEQSVQANTVELVNNVFYDNVNFISSSGVFSAFTTQTSSSVFTYSKLVDIRTAAVGTYKWNGPAYLVVNSQVFGALMKDSTIADAAKRGNNDVVTGTNLFRSIQNPGGGWNAIYEAPDLPFTNNTVGYAVTKQALVVAMRYWAPPASGRGFYTPISNPNDPTGLTLGYRDWASDDYDETRTAVTALWGRAVINPNGALILKATVNA